VVLKPRPEEQDFPVREIDILSIVPLDPDLPCKTTETGHAGQGSCLTAALCVWEAGRSRKTQDLLQSFGILNRISFKIIIKIEVHILPPFFDLLGPGLKLFF